MSILKARKKDVDFWYILYKFKAQIIKWMIFTSMRSVRWLESIDASSANKTASKHVMLTQLRSEFILTLMLKSSSKDFDIKNVSDFEIKTNIGTDDPEVNDKLVETQTVRWLLLSVCETQTTKETAASREV